MVIIIKELSVLHRQLLKTCRFNSKKIDFVVHEKFTKNFMFGSHGIDGPAGLEKIKIV